MSLKERQVSSVFNFIQKSEVPPSLKQETTLLRLRDRYQTLAPWVFDPDSGKQKQFQNDPRLEI